MADKSFPQISGMTLVISTIVLYAVNVVVLYIAHMIAPQAYVLGTHSLDMWWAVHLSMAELAILCAFIMPFVSIYEKKRQKIFSPIEWSLLYFVVDVIGLWVISRFSQQYGLGISSWMVILPLALALDFFQGLAMMAYGMVMQNMKK